MEGSGGRGDSSACPRAEAGASPRARPSAQNLVPPVPTAGAREVQCEPAECVALLRRLAHRTSPGPGLQCPGPGPPQNL